MVQTPQIRLHIPVNPRWAFAGSLVAALVLASLQDGLQAFRNGYSFYLSESIVFNTVWLLFGPVTYGQLRLFSWVRLPPGKVPGLWAAVAFVLSSSVLHLVSFSVLVWGLSVIFLDHTYALEGNLSYSLSQDLAIYLFGYGAIALTGLFTFSADSAHHPPLSTPLPQEAIADQITVLSGRTTAVICIRDIVLIRSDAPYLRIYTSGKSYLHSQTLKTMSQQLDRHQFVRVHKSIIVNLKHVASYRSRLNGDYDLLLDDETEVRLSRHYIANFRQRMENKASS